MEFPRLPGSLPGPPSLDTLISSADRALRSVFAPARAARPSPAGGTAGDLSDAERREAAALMRVNHTGEVAASAPMANDPAYQSGLRKLVRDCSSDKRASHQAR